MTDSATRLPPTAARRRQLLALSIKLLLGIGGLFLLVPFISSLPWPKAAAPEGSVLLSTQELPPGSSLLREVSGVPVLVTHLDAAQRALLLDARGERWAPLAPALLDVRYLAVVARGRDGAPLQLDATAERAPVLRDDDGHAYDIAGQALKPGPLNPDGSPLPTPNLAPLPWQARDGGVRLLPLPAPVTVARPERF
ncbi:MAG: hypothetical protein ACK4UT_03170 [Moraxellaceae bacterium]